MFYVFFLNLYLYAKNQQKQPPEVSHKKGVLRNFTKFTGKHLCQSLFFNKVAGLSTLFLQNTFFTEHFWITASESSWFINSYLKYSRLKNSAIWLADRIFEDDQLGIYKPSFTFPESVSACQKSSWFILIFLKYSWFKNPTIWMT